MGLQTFKIITFLTFLHGFKTVVLLVCLRINFEKINFFLKIVSRLGGVARNYCFPRPLFLTLANGKYAKIKVVEFKPPILPIKSTASRNLTEKKSKSFLGAKSEGVKGA